MSKLVRILCATLCSLCLRGYCIVHSYNHRDTENTEVAQRDRGLLRRLLAMKHVTRLHNGSWIDGDVSFVDVPDNAFFIDQERGAISEALLLVKDTISLHYRAFEIAE